MLAHPLHDNGRMARSRRMTDTLEGVMADLNNPNDPNIRNTQTDRGARDRAARVVNADMEDRYWRTAYASRPYVKADRGYEYYRPGYQYGWEAASRHPDRNWTDVEPKVRGEWDTAASKTGSAATGIWDELKDAVRDGWTHARDLVQDHDTGAHPSGVRVEHD
ncbi:MAG TPA: hypothetical protein VFW98_18335 [Gemmatimonadaceae bacterium]|nr:hypothetical protein [Gemmatimonadaceae bacterium]